ncbi:MAG: prolyl oligopeptidase family serine peptidase [Planctomycetota bacterium]
MSEFKQAYPSAPSDDTVDDYHGRKVADPYRPLEDVESESTREWINAQVALTNSYLNRFDFRDSIRSKLSELWDYPRYGLPRARQSWGEGVYVYSHNDGLSDQPVYRYGLGAPTSDELVLDPKTLSDDGTVAVASVVISPKGNFLLYALADGGSDWRTWKLRRLKQSPGGIELEDLPDVVRWSKFSGATWREDESGFYYGRYQQPDSSQELTGTNESQKLFFHRLGTEQADDELVFESIENPKWGYSPEVTEDGHYLVIYNWKGSDPVSQIFVMDLTDPEARPKPVIVGFDSEYEFIGNVDEAFYFLTDNQADRRRVIRVDLQNPSRARWETVVSETDDVLQSASLFGETLILNYLRDARSHIAYCDLNGNKTADFDLPGIGTASGFIGKSDARETFFSFSNSTTPAAIYRVSLDELGRPNGQSETWKIPEVPLDLDNFVTEQLFCESKDGTRVPILVTRRRDTALDGTAPTILYGYGGFNISITPSYSPAVAAWVDDGGIYAVANLRGGGEYGKAWHEAGMRLKKQNVFDDCIAAAELLIERKYASPETLSLSGRSNGGLLVGAVITQRPELFGACLPAVGVMDMLRYQKFTIGWAWVTEYGSSDESDQIDNLLSYSPLHNLRSDVCYPATMVMTADRDDRVVPGHSFKFAAALQAAVAENSSCSEPALIRIETRAGHGAGTPTSKKIDEYADAWTFLRANLRPR